MNKALTKLLLIVAIPSFLIFHFSFLPPAFAVPRMINVQGRLTENGTPVAAAISLQCEIYTSSSGGTVQWTGTYTVTPNQDGVFNVIAGSTTNPVPEFITDTYYLRIICNDVSLTDRQRLVSVPFAITARNVKGGTVSVKTVNAATSEGSVPAVKGVYGNVAAILMGRPPISSLGILGCDDGTGVYGRGRDGAVAVKGENSYPGALGLSYYGTGVEGIGTVGVRGFGVTAGGSFESSEGDGVHATGAGAGVESEIAGHGVFGETRGYNKAGVYGKGSGAHGQGVYGDGTTAAHGVYGTTAALNKAGVVATNTGGGVALEIASGKIKIPVSTRSSSLGSPHTTPMGTAVVLSGQRNVTVYNSCASSSSMIFLTVQTVRNGYAAYPVSILEKGDGYFIIRADRYFTYDPPPSDGVPPPGGEPITIAYLIIN